MGSLFAGDLSTADSVDLSDFCDERALVKATGSSSLSDDDAADDSSDEWASLGDRFRFVLGGRLGGGNGPEVGLIVGNVGAVEGPAVVVLFVAVGNVRGMLGIGIKRVGREGVGCCGGVGPRGVGCWGVGPRGVGCCGGVGPRGVGNVLADLGKGGVGSWGVGCWGADHV